jgi:MFS family permease
MVIMTIGELILIPTATTYVANLAPAEMRGRYMSVYGLTWGVATGIGPVLGGFLNDNFGPTTIWIGAFLIGISSTAGFLLLMRHPARRKTSAA